MVYYYGLNSLTVPYYTDLLTTFTGRGPITKRIVIFPNATELQGQHESRYLLGDGKNKRLQQLLDEYKTGGPDECSYDDASTKGKACKFDIDNLGPCAQLGTVPCIFVRITKVHGWVPKAYPRGKTPSMFPAYIDEYRDELPPGSPKLDTTWLGCQGKNEKDRKKIKQMTYYPIFGFPNYYFPYLGQKGYHNPMVAVRLEGFDKDVKVKIVCRIFASNVEIFDEDEGGSRTIEFSYGDKSAQISTHRTILIVYTLFIPALNIFVYNCIFDDKI